MNRQLLSYTVILLAAFLLIACSGHKKAVDMTFGDDESSKWWQADDEEVVYFTEQALRYEDYIYSGKIKTPLVFMEGDILSSPIIKLNSSNKLLFKFDYMVNDARDLYYKIIHCTAEWEESNLRPSQYIDGFHEERIRDFKFSFNTMLPYVHYTVSFPSEEVNFTKSGNYLFVVYEEDSDGDKLLLSRRFMVYEDLTAIQAKNRRSSNAQIRDSVQVINFEVRHGGVSISSPFQQVKAVIMQNYQWNSARTFNKPTRIEDNRLVYEFKERNEFPGNNEFLHADLKSIRYQSPQIAKMSYVDSLSTTLVHLHPDEVNKQKGYRSNPDINGKFAVNNTDDSQDPHVDSDYVYVTFSLPHYDVEMEGNLYVYGQLSDWSLHRNWVMHFDTENRQYQLTKLLKQGYYNYKYAFGVDGSREPNLEFIHGSFFETENNYTILIYYRGNSDIHERLIGVKQFNTQKD